MSLFKRQLQATGLCRIDNCNNSERSSNRFIKPSNEAPYQNTGRWTLAATLGYKELSSAHFWLSILSECLSCYLYVFIVCSTRISWTGAIIGHEPSLLAMSLASGLAMMLLIFTFRTVHVNPALTISFLLTGRIPLIRAILYIIVHCFGAIAAIAFLYSISIKGHAGALGLDKPHDVLNSWQILIVEIVISFFVTLATYATCNYSSYTCAKRQILEQIGESPASIFSNYSSGSSDDGNLINKQHINISNNNQAPAISSMMPASQARPHHLRRPVAPVVPENASFRTLQPQKLLNVVSNVYQEDSSEYDYDNHRIYANNQLKSASPKISIEEQMQGECQLLAPNGFSLHMTSGQALVIGLAYLLASLTGIPVSGASLNPARSLGPAFIMNRWDRHWIYWLGPIAGAVVAGFFYEFIFNPTRESSVCYRPKLFRLSAHDMAKVGTKSRLYQHHEQQQHHHHNFHSSQKLSPTTTTLRLPPPIAPSMTTTICRPQLHNSHISQMTSNKIQTLNPHLQHSPSTRQTVAMQHQSTNNLINSNQSLMKSLREPTGASMMNNPSMANVATMSAAHSQSSYPVGSNLDQMYFLQQHQNHQDLMRHQQQQQHQRHQDMEAAHHIYIERTQRHNESNDVAQVEMEPVIYDDPKMDDDSGFSNNMGSRQQQQQYPMTTMSYR